jgi:transposase-like protein
VALTSGTPASIVAVFAQQEVEIMSRARRRFTAKVKFQVVLEALKGERTPGQIAKAYGVHANSVGIWKHWFLERGPSLFERGEVARDGEKHVAELEQLLGKKEVEIALLKNFLGRSD